MEYGNEQGSTMTYYSDAMPVSYMSDGPAYPGEDAHTAMGENTAHALAGHMLSRPAHGVSVGTFSQPGQPVADAHPMAQPGGSIKDEPVDQAERAAQHTAQTVATDTQDADQAPAYSFDHAALESDIRSSLRPGAGA